MSGAQLLEVQLSGAQLSEAQLSACPGPNCPGPSCPGPSCPGPSCPGPSCPGSGVRGPIIRGPICLEPIIDFSASPIHSKTAPRNMFPAPQMFGTNISLDLLKIDILGFIHIPETTAVFMYFCILNPPPNGWARISGSNEKCLVVHTSQKLLSPPSPLPS